MAKGISLRDVLAYVRDFRARNDRTPIVLMGYANPVERYGATRFVADAQAAGVDGVLIVDYPPEESAEFAGQL
ncbi:tryptophan synthase subunit alpha, partial [Klebsiella variicola]|uniref:tryptophan synthase subunit alpha n=1 Tax=Klebsiella variicola TaxID=244366 RepID=UPI0039C03121